MEQDILNVIIQGGAVGISIALIWLVAWMLRVGIKFVSSALENNTKTMEKLINTVEKLIDKLENWGYKKG